MTYPEFERESAFRRQAKSSTKFIYNYAQDVYQAQCLENSNLRNLTSLQAFPYHLQYT